MSGVPPGQVLPIEVWTDGGCRGNPGPGGWSYILRAAGQERERRGFAAETTNNRMELTAVIEALREATSLAARPGSEVIVSTDSQYVQKGITEWIHAWSRNGWKTSAKKPVKNGDLWASLLELSRRLPVRWRWVMGHAGDEMNERCDALVQAAIAEGLKQR